MCADKITALSKMISALQGIEHTNTNEDKYIASRIKQLRWDLEDVSDSFEELCKRTQTIPAV
jgi:hypothetical protein